MPEMTVRGRRTHREVLRLLDRAPASRRTSGHDLAGPQEAELVTFARAFLQHRGEGITVHPEAESVAGIPPGALLPEEGARIQGPTFEEWLTSDDAAALPV